MNVNLNFLVNSDFNLKYTTPAEEPEDGAKIAAQLEQLKDHQAARADDSYEGQTKSKLYDVFFGGNEEENIAVTVNYDSLYKVQGAGEGLEELSATLSDHTAQVIVARAQGAVGDDIEVTVTESTPVTYSGFDGSDVDGVMAFVSHTLSINDPGKLTAEYAVACDLIATVNEDDLVDDSEDVQDEDASVEA